MASPHFSSRLIRLSRSRDFDEAMFEWFLTDPEVKTNYDYPDRNEVTNFCICGTLNKYYHLFYNLYTKEMIKVGSSCFNRFMELQPDTDILPNNIDKKKVDKNNKRKRQIIESFIDGSLFKDDNFQEIIDDETHCLCDVFIYSKEVIDEYLNGCSIIDLDLLVLGDKHKHYLNEIKAKLNEKILKKKMGLSQNTKNRNPSRIHKHMWEDDYELERDYSEKAEQPTPPIGQRTPSRLESYMWEDDYELERDYGDLWLLKKGEWIRNPNTFMGVQKKYIPAYPINYPPSSSDDNGAWALM